MLGIDHYLVQNGPSFGNRLALLRSGDLQLELLPDRGLDIGRVWFKGQQIAWTLPSGFLATPSQSQTNDWISNFGGGLLTTCGPENFGSSSVVEEFTFPLHGSFTNLRFEVIKTEQTDDYLEFTGKATHSHLFGDSWEIIRTVKLSKLNEIQVTDSLKNTGYREQPVLMLFHINLGGDFLSEDVMIDSPNDVERYSQDPSFEDSWTQFGEPILVNQETVYLHKSTEPVLVKATNHEARLGVSISSDSLQHLFQWKFRRKDRFALGLEPATSDTLGGRLNAVTKAPKIAPGSSWNHTLRIEIGQV